MWTLVKRGRSGRRQRRGVDWVEEEEREQKSISAFNSGFVPVDGKCSTAHFDKVTLLQAIKGLQRY